MAIDYRLLNYVIVFHAEIPCSIETELHKFFGVEFFSGLDLSKAYYQVPRSAKARHFTAFPIHKGLMEFTWMPFGLVTACALRPVLAGLANVSFYVDNIFVFF